MIGEVVLPIAIDIYKEALGNAFFNPAPRLNNLRSRAIAYLLERSAVALTDCTPGFMSV